MKQSRSLIFFLIFAAFFFDLLLFSLAQRPVSLFLVAVYYLLFNTCSLAAACLMVLCITLESIVMTPYAHSLFIFILLFTLIDQLIARIFHVGPFERASAYFVLTLIGFNAPNQGLFSVFDPYTLGLICVTLIVMKYIEITLKVD